MSAWHAEVTLTQMRLRRYDAAHTPAEAAEMYAARAPYQAIANAEIRDGRAWLDGMLVAGRPLGRDDRRQLKALLERHGATLLEADRHGRLITRVR